MFLPRGFHVSGTLKDMKPLKSWSKLSENQSKCYKRGWYKALDEALLKFSGSDNLETQRDFLKARFQAIHVDKVIFTPLVEQCLWLSLKRTIRSFAND